MRILVLASTFPRWTGDTVPPFVHHLSAGLAGRGHEIHVLAPHAAGAAGDEELDGVHVHRFRYAPAHMESLCYDGGILENLRRHPIRWSLVPAFMSAQFVAMLRIVRRYKVDAIHAHWVLPQGLLTAVGRPLFSCPIVISAHGSDVFAMKRGIRRSLLKFAARQANVCTAVSSVLQRELLRLTGVEATVIPMGVNPSAFNMRLVRKGARHARNPAGPRVIFVGRLVQQKGVRYLIEAMTRVRSAIPDARLVIVGDGPERLTLQTFGTDLGLGASVVFAGAVPHTEIPAHYGEAEVFVLPSLRSGEGDTEGMPVVLLEAAASGVAMVASGIGGIPDLIQHEETGLLVEPGDPGAIASAITRLLGDDALRHAIAARSRERVVERFSWDVVVSQFDDVFRSLHSPQ